MADSSSAQPKPKTPASPPAAPPAARPSAQPQPQPDHHVKETIESILVAFILAFVFRGFVVEAFVIPTGSMGPTLLGAHMRYHCDDCGWRWTVSYSSGRHGADIDIPSRGVWYRTAKSSPQEVPVDLHCPNCAWAIPKHNPREPDNSLTSPPVHYGDRILVLKYLYLFEEPKRWDVVVFKTPALRQGDARRPDKEMDYAENYIKRLVGTPGERVMIVDGDIYVSPLGTSTTSDWSTYQVQRKPDHVQQALWRNVYDNDFVPHLDRNPAAPPFVQPWREQAAVAAAGRWTTTGPDGKPSRVFTFDGMNGSGTLAFDRDANPHLHHLTDFTSYDAVEDGRYHDPARRADDVPVNDLRLALHYTRAAGDGPLRLTLARGGGDHTLVAELAPGRATLIHAARGGAAVERVRKSAEVKALAANRPVRVEFANVDYRASLKIDGVEVLAEDYAPDVAALVNRASPDFPEIRISADRQQARVEHLSLARDVYYLSRGGAVHWGTPEQPIELGPDEFFVLGDNPIISGDARIWRDRVDLPDEDLSVDSGRVPRRFMIGKAFFVYWPAGYRPFNNAPGLIPNFGDMRFIH